MNNNDFSEIVQQKGKELYREMPWRRDIQPYYVLVSELMLQQTQVDRVIPKFEAFITRFPDVNSLGNASLGEVLTLWNGLGYNRRAKFLYESAKRIVMDLGGKFPEDKSGLLTLPGVGDGTAGAILTYAFNQPVVFIETNVRTVYFYHFFTDGEKVSDKEVAVLIEQTIDHEHPREFYWALMDYGTWLKKQGVGRIVQSKHYKKQPALKGSIRELRGHIIHLLTTEDTAVESLRLRFAADSRLEAALTGLVRDGLVQQTGDILHLTK